MECATDRMQASVPKQALFMIKALRPRQWTKNLIVFAAPLFSGHIHEAHSLIPATWCFVAFCLMSGAVYILNDVVDAKADALHPTKSRRPIASKQVSPTFALMFSVAVALLSLTISAWVRPTLCLILAAYLVLQIAYSCFGLKRRALIDVGCIAAGFVLRALAGAVAVHVPMSVWFLLCTGLGSLFLALEKRRQEIKLLGANAADCRKVLGEYSMEVLNRLEAMILPSLIVAYTLYSFLSYHGQWMMLSLPFVLYGTARYLMLSANDTVTGSPEEVLLKDRPIQITLILWALTSGLVIYNIIPTMVHSISRAADKITF